MQYFFVYCQLLFISSNEKKPYGKYRNIAEIFKKNSTESEGLIKHQISKQEEHKFAFKNENVPSASNFTSIEK